MLPFGRRLSLVTDASPDSVLSRLARNVTVDATPGVPFRGVVDATRFRIQPVWTRTIAGAQSSAGSAFSLPICRLQGEVSPAGEGARIEAQVVLMWPLPMLFLMWSGLYVSGLMSRPFSGRDEAALLIPAVSLLAGAVLAVRGLGKGAADELRRITMSQVEAPPTSRP